MRDAILRNVPGKTGHSVDHWVRLVRGSGLDRHMARVQFLKSHGVRHSTASVLVQLAEGDAFEDAPEAQHLTLQSRTSADRRATAGKAQPARNLGSGMIDRKVELSAPADLDNEVTAWLRQAYEAAG